MPIRTAHALVFALLVVLAACAEPSPPAIDAPDDGPPADASEDVVEEETDAGTVAAELTADPTTVDPGEPVEIVVVNHGEVQLGYGRPITVERWDGAEWVETDGSRESVWTMELLMLPPGRTGVVQTWPFSEDDAPAAGWYRFTKSVHAESGEERSAELVIRARVRVDG